MLAKRIIPCLDVDRGRVVKGVPFLNLRDAGDPVAIACAYSEQGADEIAFLDITATVEKRRNNSVSAPGCNTFALVRRLTSCVTFSLP